MGYRLADGVSFVIINDQAIFLDVARDRYFAVPATAVIALDQPQPTDGREHDDRQPRSLLIERGIIHAVPDMGGIRQTETCGAPMQSIGTAPGPNLSPWNIFAAMRLLIAFRIGVRRRPLHQLITDIKALKANIPPSERADAEMIRLARAFAAADLWVTPRRACLSRSLALIHASAQQGYGCEFIIGVAVNPFRAHSWVQRGTLLLNDRPDRVAQFAPILRV
ncbi:hypothetical protein BH10PSE12_BH10PSE12_08550 [soil metagenome]